MGEALIKAVSDPIDNCSKYVFNDCESSGGCSNCFTCDVKTDKVYIDEGSEEIANEKEIYCDSRYRTPQSASSSDFEIDLPNSVVIPRAVSYTHLTLPTIYSV